MKEERRKEEEEEEKAIAAAVVAQKSIALVKSFTNFIILNATSVCCLYGACKTSLNYYHQLAPLHNNLTYLLFSGNTFDL